MHDAVKGFRVSMTHVKSHMFDTHLVAPPQEFQSHPEFHLLSTWLQEILSHTQVFHRQELISLMCKDGHQFARMIRATGWRVYHYKYQEEKTPRNKIWQYDPWMNTHWGYIVAPYCGKFLEWRLAHG